MDISGIKNIIQKLTNRPVIREDATDLIYMTAKAKCSPEDEWDETYG